MKKIYVILVCAIMSQSCSGLGSIQAEPSPVSTNTATQVPSATSTVPTPTFTSTPTLIVPPRTDTPTSDAALTQAAETPLFLITPNTSTPSPQMKGFLRVNVSGPEFYKGQECQPTSVQFTAQVSDVLNTAYVLLFVRLKSKQSGVTGDWADSIKMKTIGAGTYVHDLVTMEMKGVPSFQNAWVQYQFVATNDKGREIGRTDIFSERLTLLECKPTPTPEVSPTPTVLIQ